MNHETARRIAFAYIGNGTCKISGNKFRAVGKAGLFETPIDPYENSVFPIKDIDKSIEEILIQTQSIFMLDNQAWLPVSLDMETAWEEYDFTEDLEMYKDLQGAIVVHAGSLYITNKDCTVVIKKKTPLVGSYFVPFGHSKGMLSNLERDGKLVTIIRNDLGLFANKQFITSIIEVANIMSHEKLKMSEDFADFINSTIEITGVLELYGMGFPSYMVFDSGKMLIKDPEGETLFEHDNIAVPTVPKFSVNVQYWSMLSPKKVQIPKAKAVVIYCRDRYDNFSAMAPIKWWTD